MRVDHFEASVEITEYKSGADKVDRRTERMMASTSLKARVNRARTHVVCGRPECGGIFGELHWKLLHEDDFGDLLAPKGFVKFLPGLVPDATDNYRLSKRAENRIFFGGSPKLRRYPVNRGVADNDVMEETLRLLPVTTTCPTCGFRNILLAEELGVESVYRPVEELRG